MTINKRNDNDVYAPIEDVEVSLGIKVLVLLMLLAMIGTIWGVVIILSG